MSVMKLMVLTCTTLLISSSAVFAQDYGNISLNDGKNIFRINIGNDRDRDVNLSRRVVNLERAVRDLQNRVYDLQDYSVPARREVTIFTCTLPNPFRGTFIGKAKTETEARANAVNECKKGGAFPCTSDYVSSCETSIEIERN